MKSFKIILILFSLARGMTAAADTSHFAQGMTSVTATGGAIGYSSYCGVLISLNLAGEHFVSERFSVGVASEWQNFKNDKIYGLGPSASYYFWESGNLAARFNANLLYIHNEIYGQPNGFMQAGADVGLAAFLTDSFSIGGAFGLRHRFEDDNRLVGEPTEGYLALQLSAYF